MERKKKNYIDHKVFYDEMVKSFEQDELTPKAIEFCMKIIERVAKCNHYDSADDLEDCKAYAMYNILRYWRNFDVKKYDNPFSYFTSYAWTGLSQGWNQLHPVKERGIVKISMSCLEDANDTE